MHDDPSREPLPGADPSAPDGPAAGPRSATAPPMPEPSPAPPPRQRRGPLVVGLVAMLAVGLAGGFAVGRLTAPAASSAASASPGVPNGSPAAVSPGVSPTDRFADVERDGTRLGRADAPVTVEVWADYQCPFCGRFSDETLAALAPQLRDGSVTVVHRDYAFLGPESFDAAVAARCALPEGRYWEMHDAIYGAQSGENQGAFARPVLIDLAADVGLDAEAFAACLDDRAVLLDVLDETASGVRTGISSTPTAVVVGGQRFTGVPDIEELTASIESVAGGASPVPEPSPTTLPDQWAALEPDGSTAGPADAPVVVELWSDYQAANARTFAAEVQPVLLEAATAGRIRVERRDAAGLGSESVAAASAVRCADRLGESGWFVHDVLQASGQGVEAGVFTRENLTFFVTRLGFDVSAFDACMDDPAVADAVEAETASATAAGVSEAPALVIRSGDRVVEVLQGTIAAADLEAAIEAAGSR